MLVCSKQVNTNTQPTHCSGFLLFGEKMKAIQFKKTGDFTGNHDELTNALREVIKNEKRHRGLLG